MSTYEELERAARAPNRVADHTARWEKLTPVEGVHGQLGERLAAFCAAKGITIESLAALGARLVTRRNGAVELAFAGYNAAGVVVAIKYRPLGGTSHDSYAENPSTWRRPIVVGNRESLDWIVAEGETDAARLYDLVGDRAAILVLPAGALTFRRDWASLIPRGATVALAHDADEHGDKGAEKAAKIIGGTTLRLRPPVDGGDWCDWAGERDELLELLRAAAAATRSAIVVPVEEFAAVREDSGEPLIGTDDQTLLAADGTVMYYGEGGAGKTTAELDLAFHVAAGVDWHQLSVARRVRGLILEAEGPRGKMRTKLAAKLAAWTGPSPDGWLHVIESPWATLNLADPGHRDMLAHAITEIGAEIVYAGPVSALGLEGGGTPAEVRAFVAHLEDIRARVGRPVAFLLIAHTNKGGQVAGAWEGATDTLAHVQALGNGRTRIHWQKARWAGELHGTSWHLLWRDGETFEMEDNPRLDDGDVLDKVLAHVRENPGTSWRKVENDLKGVGNDRLRAARDGALERKEIVDLNQLRGKGNGMRLYLADDPTLELQQLEVCQDSGTPPAHPAPGKDAAGNEESVPCAVPKRHGTPGTITPGASDGLEAAAP